MSNTANTANTANWQTQNSYSSYSFNVFYPVLLCSIEKSLKLNRAIKTSKLLPPLAYSNNIYFAHKNFRASLAPKVRQIHDKILFFYISYDENTQTDRFVPHKRNLNALRILKENSLIFKSCTWLVLDPSFVTRF